MTFIVIESDLYPSLWPVVDLSSPSMLLISLGSHVANDDIFLPFGAHTCHDEKLLNFSCVD